jgi:hypothetical protein
MFFFCLFQMNQTPIAIKEEDKKESPTVFKTIAPTTVATLKNNVHTNSHPPLQKNVPAFLNKLYR